MPNHTFEDVLEVLRTACAHPEMYRASRGLVYFWHNLHTQLSLYAPEDIPSISDAARFINQAPIFQTALSDSYDYYADIADGTVSEPDLVLRFMLVNSIYLSAAVQYSNSLQAVCQRHGDIFFNRYQHAEWHDGLNAMHDATVHVYPAWGSS